MTGCVYLIGAGCGRADLITLRGLDRLRRCDAVVYDDLIDEALLDEAPAEAERIYMGKRQGKHSAAQEEICDALILLARQGKRVARLKGGDPFVFGRGGEEAMALAAAGIPCEEVPGISSCIAIPAAAGIPVTHRGVSRSVHVVTAHTADRADGLPEDLEQLAALHGTLVFLMGLSRLALLADGLLAAGKPADTPAAVLSGGSAPYPAAVRGTLADIAQRTREAGVQPPAVIVVGPTAGMTLPVSGTAGPLSGVRIGVTGTPQLADRLTAALTDRGAQVTAVERSIVEPLPLELDLHALTDGCVHWLVLTSANGVRIFFRRLQEAGVDLRRLHRCRFAVIGRPTGQVLADHGIRPDLCPEVYTSEDLARALCAAVAPGEDVFLLRARHSAAVLPEMLAAHGITVHRVPLYDLHPDHRVTERTRGLLDSLDYLTFSSASGVESFFQEHGAVPERTVCVCIGRVTAAALARWDGRPCLTAAAAAVPDVVRVIQDHHTAQ